MKILRFLAMAALLFGISGIAKADPTDFVFGVLDPPSGPGYAVIEPGVPFELQFVSCPSFIPYEGCFLGVNDSNEYLTSLDFTFPNNSSLNGQTCSTVGTFFTDASCSFDPTDGVYSVDFSGGGGIPPWIPFLVVENGVDPSDFPEAVGLANAPEPGSVWLLLSGAGMAAYLAYRRRIFNG